MKEKIPQTEVLAWLQANHPALHASSGVDRAWVWVAADLRGDNNKETREALKAYGFRFAKKGHTLASGALAMWGHCCDRPMPFKRKGGGGQQTKPNKDGVFSPSELAEAAKLFA